VTVRAGYPPEDVSTTPIGRPKWFGTRNARRARRRTRFPAQSGCFCRSGRVGEPSASFGLDSTTGTVAVAGQRRLLDSLADQAALAIERINLMQDIDRARMTAETERLRSALLTSIPRSATPLASDPWLRVQSEILSRDTR